MCAFYSACVNVCVYVCIYVIHIYIRTYVNVRMYVGEYAKGTYGHVTVVVLVVPVVYAYICWNKGE